MKPEIVKGESPQLDDGPFVAGKIYRRPGVVLDNPEWTLPVLHSHTGEFSGEEHYHLDMRFVPAEYAIRRHLIMGCAGTPVVAWFMCVSEFAPPVCEVFSEEQRAAYQDLEQRNGDEVCRDDLCPHQGCDLSVVQPNQSDDGRMVRTCPCHGLQWDTATGVMVPRKTPLTLVGGPTDTGREPEKPEQEPP